MCVHESHRILRRFIWSRNKCFIMKIWLFRYQSLFSFIVDSFVKNTLNLTQMWTLTLCYRPGSSNRISHEMGKTSFFIVCASNAQHFHTCTTLIHMLMVMPVLIYASTPANSHSIKPANICSTIFRFTFVYIVISTLQTKILNHVFVPTDGFAWPFITNWIFDVLQTVCICIQVYARASVCVYCLVPSVHSVSSVFLGLTLFWYSIEKIARLQKKRVRHN